MTNFEKCKDDIFKITKHWRGEENHIFIAEEIADVEIMLEQIKHLLGIKREVDQWKNRKILRQMKRMEGGKMKIYISGAITNNENYKKDFEKAESEVRGLGGIPYNPARIELPPEADYEEYMKLCLDMVDMCEKTDNLPTYIGKKPCEQNQRQLVSQKMGELVTNKRRPRKMGRINIIKTSRCI